MSNAKINIFNTEEPQAPKNNANQYHFTNYQGSSWCISGAPAWRRLSAQRCRVESQGYKTADSSRLARPYQMSQ